MPNSSPLKLFGTAVASLTMLWLVFPPVGFWWLAWVAPIPLVGLMIKRRTSTDSAPQDFNGISTKRSWLALWLAGVAYWLATFYFIPLPHPALWFGWLAVSLYLGLYLPLWVAVSRCLIWRYEWPAIIAIPVAWTGLEWLRSNLFTGMAMVCLSHSQFKQPILIQMADLTGAYGLSFVMMVVATGIVLASQRPGNDATRVGPITVIVLTLMFVLGYGYFRLQEEHELADRSINDRSINVGLIQGSLDVVFEQNSEEEHWQRFDHYYDLTQQALAQWPDVDVIVWPESSFLLNDLLSDYSDEATQTNAQHAIRQFWQSMIAPGSEHAELQMIVGGRTADPNEDADFASALWIRSPGEVVGRYFKNHLVMFGEYVPFSNWIPLLQHTPLGKGVTAGKEFSVFDVNGVRLAPTICFETTVPHWVRRMVNDLERRCQTPDAILNLTNDGWFFGTSALDLHLACNVFRAVEMRIPVLACANTGFSAEIDHCGRLLQIGPRRATGLLKARVKPSTIRYSLYRQIGDTVPMIFGLGGVGMWLLACWRNNRRKGE